MAAKKDLIKLAVFAYLRIGGPYISYTGGKYKWGKYKSPT